MLSIEWRVGPPDYSKCTTIGEKHGSHLRTHTVTQTQAPKVAKEQRDNEATVLKERMLTGRFQTYGN